MTEYRDLVPDFARRTLFNLDVMRQATDEGKAGHEVTQLWNSLMGLIVAPRERDFRRLPRIGLAELYARGWPDITTAGRVQEESLRGLMGTLRNAVAHFNVEFHANIRGEIHEVVLWNAGTGTNGMPQPNLPHRWDGCATVDQLDQLARNIAKAYIDNLGTRPA